MIAHHKNLGSNLSFEARDYFTCWMFSKSKSAATHRDLYLQWATYSEQHLIKGQLKREAYTNVTDKLLRRCLAKFRCSDHRLRIEVGRRENVAPEDRVCLMCDENSVEDDFLTSCSEYSPLRMELYHNVGLSVRNFNVLLPEQKFVFLMSCEDIQIIRWVACFIKNALEMRWSVSGPWQHFQASTRHYLV